MEIPNTLPCRQQLAAIEQAAHFTQCTRNLPTASLVPYRIWRTPKSRHLGRTLRLMLRSQPPTGRDRRAG
jgi:hypothetical protein